MALRITRNRARLEAVSQPTPRIEHLSIHDPDPTTTYHVPTSILSISAKPINSLPPTLTRKRTGLKQQSQILLLQKQRALRALNFPCADTIQEYFVSQSTFLRARIHSPLQPSEEVNVSHAVLSTFFFGQECGGTAVCIHESGLILTCAHCVAESRDEFEQDHIADKWKRLWLLNAVGEVLLAKCVAWDERRDLALLKVISGQNVGTLASPTTLGGDDAARWGFTSLRISSSRPHLKTEVVCIGQPSSEDVETSVEGVKTGYPALAISRGQFLGYAPGQDVEDNSEIGVLMHDAWTYWGHSGAPIVGFRGQGGCLVGLHSSWDNQIGTRRGVGIEAMHGFLSEIDHVLQSGNFSDILVRF